MNKLFLMTIMIVFSLLLFSFKSTTTQDTVVINGETYSVNYYEIEKLKYGLANPNDEIVTRYWKVVKWLWRNDCKAAAVWAISQLCCDGPEIAHQDLDELQEYKILSKL